MLITFSGLDGAGKSTLIAELKKVLEKNNLRVSIRTMYDDLTLYALFRQLRDRIKKALKIHTKEKKDISQEFNLIPNGAKADISDKNDPVSRFIYRIFRSRFIRKLSLLGDLFIITIYRFIEEGIRNRVLITDRYFYDSWVDTLAFEEIESSSLRFFIPFVPQPDMSVFVDVPPEVAFARKREYPLNYLEWRREAYLKVFQKFKNSLILDNTQEIGKNIETLCDFALKDSCPI